jgi:hypothetical protein
MKRTWRVDNATTVDFNTGSFGRQTVLVNGEEFYRRRAWRGKALYEFVVPGSGTKAALEVRPAVVSGPSHTELRVGGRVMVEQSEIISCKACGYQTDTMHFAATAGRRYRSLNPTRTGAS